MYPKVKVREQEQDDQHAYERSSLQSLKAFESLSIHDFSSPDDSPPSIVRIPRSFISNPITPSVPVSKGTVKKKNKKVEEENKSNIRASSVPRPRAVLSSPDNDGMIGSKHKTKEELLSGLKNHNLCKNRHTQCKVIPGPIVAECPVNTRRKYKEAADSKNNLQGRKGSVSADPRRRAYLGEGKP